MKLFAWATPSVRRMLDEHFLPSLRQLEPSIDLHLGNYDDCGLPPVGDYDSPFALALGIARDTQHHANWTVGIENKLALLGAVAEKMETRETAIP